MLFAGTDSLTIDDVGSEMLMDHAVAVMGISSRGGAVGVEGGITRSV